MIATPLMKGFGGAHTFRDFGRKKFIHLLLAPQAIGLTQLAFHHLHFLAQFFESIQGGATCTNATAENSIANENLTRRRWIDTTKVHGAIFDHHQSTA